MPGKYVADDLKEFTGVVDVLGFGEVFPEGLDFEVGLLLFEGLGGEEAFGLLWELVGGGRCGFLAVDVGLELGVALPLLGLY